MFYTVKITRGKTVHLQKVYIGVDDTTLKNFAAIALRDCGGQADLLPRRHDRDDGLSALRALGVPAPRPFLLGRVDYFENNALFHYFAARRRRWAGPRRPRNPFVVASPP